MCRGNILRRIVPQITVRREAEEAEGAQLQVEVAPICSFASSCCTMACDALPQYSTALAQRVSEVTFLIGVA